MSPEDFMCMFHMCMLDAQDTLATPACGNDEVARPSGHKPLTEKERGHLGYFCISCRNAVRYNDICGNLSNICLCTRCSYTCRRKCGLDDIIVSAIHILIESSSIGSVMIDSNNTNIPLDESMTSDLSCHDTNSSIHHQSKTAFKILLNLATFHPALWLRYLNLILMELYKSYYQSLLSNQIVTEYQKTILLILMTIIIM